ncbi:MAG: SagB/ThcOx family dehydrogenase [Planctomycetes bacterium]|nr:SagB/ThcOx family dehydrogenase [Planctomycetota bacterium]
MKNPFTFLRPSRGDEPEPERAPADPLDVVRAYHAATCHHFHRYARGPGELDWETQPDPFRRYTGAELLPLEHVPADSGPTYAAVMGDAPIPPAPLDRTALSALLLDAFGLTAWKQYGTSTWALRANPSSGNLHPTEAHVLAPRIASVCDTPFAAHYAPREHALELRARLTPSAWSALADGLPDGTLFVALTSIHWREAWKYGERAYRYCQHDVGHALGALAVSAAALGRRMELCDALGRDDLLALLGLADARGAEAEEPDVLVALVPREANACVLPSTIAPTLLPREFAGRPNELSPAHVHWGAIDAVAEACRKPRSAGNTVPEQFFTRYGGAAAPPYRVKNCSGTVFLRRIVRQRRSAVDFDGKTELAFDAFLHMLAQTSRGPVRALPWRPQVHLALFVHRVTGLERGLYLCARDPDERPLLQAAFEKPFAWERVDTGAHGPELWRLDTSDQRAAARALACQQDIAADSAFALGMIARFEPALAEHGAWFYPRLFWECGVVGQVLYLEAEAAGVRATGIGCFFDEPVHAHLGLASTRYRSLYHFTVGGPKEDARLTTWPASPPRDSAPTTTS